MDSLYSRYASALLSIALEENKVKEYKSEIKVLKEVFKENEDLSHLLSSYFLLENDKDKIIDEIFKCDDLIKNFIKVITKNKRIKYIDKIFDEFIERVNELENIKEGICYSVNKLSDEQMNKIKEAIEIKTKTKVELVNKIDPRLIGGIKIVIGDKVFDGSVKNKLSKLQEELKVGGK